MSRSKSNPEVKDVAASICGALSDGGYTYTFSADNRGGNRSCYVFVTRPVCAKIRISDHPSDRADKEVRRSKTAVLDVGLGRHGISPEQAIQRLEEIRGAIQEGDGR